MNVHDQVEIVTWDIRVPVAKSYLRDVEYVIHLAAVSTAPDAARDPQMAYEVNVMGTLNLVDAMPDSVRRFIFASSAAIYQTAPASEDDQTFASSWYSATKIAAEDVVRMACKKSNRFYTLLRFFNVYGPRGGDQAITRLVRGIKSGLPFVIHGDGSQTRDYVHVDDVVEAILYACDRMYAGGMAMNVGSGVDRSVVDLVSQAARVKGEPVVCHVDPSASPGVMRSRANIDKIRHYLSWSPEISLHDGLGRLLKE
jgi:UDP-glucose 4-epimerase